MTTTALTGRLEPQFADEPRQASPTAMQLIQQVLATGGNATEMAHVIKELAAIQQSQERFQWEREERQARIDFDEALSNVQKQIGRISPDKDNPGVRGGAKYLTYAKLDKIIRPLYTAEGFSISFGEVDCPHASKIRVVAHVSRGGITRQYLKDVTPPLLGPKGEPVMTATHGDTSANSYARRYLLYDIFNIAVGIDADDTDGSPERTMDADELQDALDTIRQAPNPAKYEEMFRAAHKAAKDDQQAHLDIDVFAIKQSPTPDIEKAIFKIIFSKRRDEGNDRALRLINDAHNAAKSAFLKGGAL